MSTDKSKTIAKNTLFLYIRMILVLLVNLYSSRVILRVLGVEDFGIFNLVGGVVVFLGFFQAALTNATYRFFAYELGAGNDEKLNKVYSVSVNCHLLLAFVLFVIMELVGVWFINNELTIPENRISAANWLYQFSLLTFVASIIRTPYNSVIIAYEKMNFYAIISIIEALLKLAILFILVLLPCDELICYSILLFGVSMFVLAGYFLFCRIRFTNLHYYRCWDTTLVKSISSYSGWSLFVNAADVMTNQSISIFFNWFIGITANAALGIMNQVNAGLNLLVSNFSQAFNPQLIKSYAAKDYDYFMHLIYSTSKLSYLLYLIIAIPIAANIDFVLKIWLGDYPSFASEFILATLVYYMADSLQSPLFNAVHATGKIKYHHMIVGTIKIMAIPSIYLALRMGMNGVQALLVWSIINVIVSIARTFYMHRLIQLNLSYYCFHVICPLFVLTVITGALVVFIKNHIEVAWLSLFSTIILSTFSIIVCSLLFVFDTKERGILLRMPIINKLLKDSSKN